MDFFKKKNSEDTIEAKKSWYADRYQSVVVQRNLLLLLTISALIGIVVAVLIVVQVTTSKTIEPFVIEIEEKTGITNVIRPLLKEKFAYDEALRKYFIMKYMNARETYSNNSFKYNYYTVARLLSTSKVNASFRRSVNVNNPGSPLRLGQNGTKSIKIKSTSLLTTAKRGAGFTVQIRFASTTTNSDNKSTTRHKIATMSFNYFDLVLTEKERNINPLGFQVTSYRVDNETI